MTLNWKRERLDNLIVLFNNQSLSMSEDSSNNILPLKSFFNKISRTININFTMRINFSDKGNFSSGDRECKVTMSITIFLKAEPFRKAFERFPEFVSKHAGESCAMLFLSKPSVRFFIVIIPQESLISSFKSAKGRTVMSSKDSLLPEVIKTFNRGISTWLSLWDEYQMYSHKQMESDKLGDTVGVTSSASSRHLVIHLGYPWNPQMLPCFDEMLRKGDGLFVRKLAGGNCMPSHIQSMKGIESGNPLWTSEMSGSHNVCLMEVSHLLCLKIRIRLLIAVSFWFNLACFAVTSKYSGYCRDRRGITNLSLFKLPLDNLRPNAREDRSASLVRFQLLPNRENSFEHRCRGFSPDLFWGTIMLLESLKPMFLISVKPFREPESASLNQLEYLFKANSFFVKLYCFAAFFIFILILHRLFLLQILFRRSLGDRKFTYRCYDINLVIDVMT